jgi:hypothetical protein
MGLLISPDYILNSSGDKKVLLLQAQLFTLEDIIIGIKNLGYILGYGLFRNSFDIITVIKIIKIEFP